MNPIYNKDKIQNSNLKHTNKMWKIGFSIITLILIIIVYIGIIEFNDLTRGKESLNLTVKRLSQENQNIKRKSDINERLLKSSQVELRKLTHENRRLKNRTYTSSNNKTSNYVKPTQKKSYTPAKNYTQSYTPTNRKQKTYTQPKTIASIKKYQNFSKNIKLKSYSKITKKSDNRLDSTTVIYGMFHPKPYSVINPHKNQIANIKCGLKNNRYKAIDECSMELGNNFDRVYLGTMDAKSIKDFNYKTHMIECTYSKEHGIMHSCKKKMS
ncbi:MAG: hypothetical protein ACI9TV_001643 [Sulfurimonas sp.]|jgi:hypothetical protein|uniref:hypothetical protein n=1 Tax=Sulfurimonas sp. TaxID=2022749 RepID=UPI0039E4CF8F